jgi:hypothetical protein
MEMHSKNRICGLSVQANERAKETGYRIPLTPLPLRPLPRLLVLALHCFVSLCSQSLIEVLAHGTRRFPRRFVPN